MRREKERGIRTVKGDGEGWKRINASRRVNRGEERSKECEEDATGEMKRWFRSESLAVSSCLFPCRHFQLLLQFHLPLAFECVCIYVCVFMFSSQFFRALQVMGFFCTGININAVPQR